MRLVTENTSSNAFTDKISALVKEAKHNTQWRKSYMDFERQKAYWYDDGVEAGVIQGAQKKAIEVAKNLLKMNLGTPEQIAQAEGIPVEQVLEIKKSLAL